MPNITTFSKSTVVKLLKKYDCVKYKKSVFEKEVWIYENHVIISLPSDDSRIEYDDVEMIALEQLDMSVWEFDLWIGENS